MIGVFDSGSGGLTVLKELRREMPSADFLYFGDIKNAPYGLKTPNELLVLTSNALAFLHQHGARHVVSACNSVSSSLVESHVDIREIVEMTGPTAAHFRDSVERLLLIATPATIRSGIYQQAFGAVGKEVETLALAELAGAIEFGKPEAEVEKIIRDAFAGVKLTRLDTVILACTHYPLVESLFGRVLGHSLQLFDPATAVAAEAARRFGAIEQGTGAIRFFITAESAPFLARVEELFPDSGATIEVVA